MKHLDRLIERFKIIKQGQSLKDVPIFMVRLPMAQEKKLKSYLNILTIVLEEISHL